jgi:ketosteroid isomerase-like protein
MLPRLCTLFGGVASVGLGGLLMSPESTPPSRQAAAAPGNAAVARLNAAINAHDLPALSAAITDDCVFENTAPAPDGTRIAGRIAVLQFWERWFTSNPEGRFEVEEEFTAGDRVVVRWVYRKTREGRPWHLRGVDVFRVRDGRVAEKLAYVKG